GRGKISQRIWSVLQNLQEVGQEMERPRDLSFQEERETNRLNKGRTERRKRMILDCGEGEVERMLEAGNETRGGVRVAEEDSSK
ncbi:hypothetical protein ABG768_009318, partial [Culter alburnus]